MEKLHRTLSLVVLALVGVAALPLAANEWSTLSRRRALNAQAAQDLASGNDALAAGDADLAAQAFAAGLRRDPASRELADGLRTAHIAQIADRSSALNAAEAVRLQLELEVAVNRDGPHDARLLLAYGRLLEARGFTERARTRLQQAIAADDKLARARIDLGRILLGESQPAAAAEQLERALAIAPDDADARFLLGKIRAGEEKWDDAALHLRRAVEQRPTDPRVLTALGEVLARAEKWVDAEAVLERAVRLQPNDGDLLGLYARALAANQKTLAAVEQYRAAWKLTGNWSYSSRLGRLYQRLDQHEAAIRVFLELSQLRPSDPYPLCQAAFSYEAMTDTARAMQFLEQCAARAEKDPSQEKVLLSARGRLEAMRAALAAGGGERKR